jgi:xylulokinase
VSYLGIDLGTSGLRALLVDANGAPVATAEAHYPVANPQSGWSEQDPADWIEALETVIAKLRAEQPVFAELTGIGVAGHMHGAVLLDAGEAVLRPCILWNDTRSAAEAAMLDADPNFRAFSGNIVFPGFTAPKLAWVRAHEPEIFAQVAKVLLPAAFLNLYLTGQAVGDISDAAGTSWLDVGKRAWSDPLLAATGLGVAQMPRLVEGSAVAGQLRADLARDWGVAATVCVAGGAADNAAAACGMGVLSEGQGFVSLGTSGVVLAARGGYHPDPETALHTFCHAIPETWYQMGVMLSATDCLNWLSRITGQSPSDLTAELGTQLATPSGVQFLPYLSGERTPHNDASLRGSFTGLSVTTTRADMTRAVLEGVAFGLRDSMEAIRGTGARLETVYAIGGGARSSYWLRLLATVFDTPLWVPNDGEFGAALGAARLAAVAVTGARPETVMTPPTQVSQVLPCTELTAAYEDAYRRFKART